LRSKATVEKVGASLLFILSVPDFHFLQRQTIVLVAGAGPSLHGGAAVVYGALMMMAAAAVAPVSSSPVIRPHPHAVIDKMMTPLIITPPIKSPAPTPPIAAVITETDEKEEVMMPPPPPLIMTNFQLGFVAPADEIMSSSPSRSHFVGGLFGDPESQREPFIHLDYALKY